MSRLPLTIATTDYDHFRDIRTGAVAPEGIDLNWLLLGHHECFARMTANREFDLSEMSFAKFAAQVTRQDADLIGLPVICSRLFRFSSFYVNRKAGIERAEDLYGKRVGSPEWAHSAAVWMRGWMQNELGMDLARIRWFQAGANAPGREEKVELSLPEGVEIARIKDRSLFPFGVEENRATWERMALYTHQQGIAHRRFPPEEIFPASCAPKVII